MEKFWKTEYLKYKEKLKLENLQKGFSCKICHTDIKHNQCRKKNYIAYLFLPDIPMSLYLFVKIQTAI